jgi:hypothetical protein
MKVKFTLEQAMKTLTRSKYEGKVHPRTGREGSDEE